jgi:hypothetical protein
MSKLYGFPETAKYGRIVPKSKIYDIAKPNKKIKELFVSEVEKIVWAYKLSPETINIPASVDVQEIQIFDIFLRTKSLSKDVLKTIDKAIPSQIIFQLNYNGKIRNTTSYKRPSEADKKKWVISSYFESEDFLDEKKEQISELPVTLNMGGLLEQIIKEISSIKTLEKESLQELVERADKIKEMEQYIEKLKSKIKSTKQYNRKVELNQKLNKLSEDYADLII